MVETEVLTSYAWAFGQGVLVDLTPCVYPLIPITVAVFGARGVTRPRALMLAAAYVLGMATLYTTLGVVVALTGAAFGSWLANPWVVIPIVAVLIALAASMFGAFDLQLPVSIQNRLGTVGGAGPVGAFTMGLVSGFISAPCTGPVLLSLLAYIAQSSAEGASVLHGGSLLFVYALGMGTLFFAVALGASLFRPGPWMQAVKSVFGIALLVMALWFLRPLSPAIEDFMVHPGLGLWLGALAVAVGLALGAVHLSFSDARIARVRKAFGVGGVACGAFVLVNNGLYVPPATWSEVSSVTELDEAVARAQAADKPLVIDFAARWCMPCKEMELQTFHHADVEPVLSSRFALVKVDVTDATDEQVLLQALFDAETLPSVVVYASDAAIPSLADAIERGAPLPAPAVRFRTFVDASTLLAEIENVR